jgi:predicted deacylase
MAALSLLKHLETRYDLRGTVLIVPVANPISFDQRIRSTWVDALHSGNTGNLNRVWPGRDDGFLTERLAHVISSQVISRADVVLDIHNGMPGRLTIYYGYHYAGHSQTIERSNELSIAFGIEILVEGAAPDVAAAPTLGSYVLDRLDRPFVMVELGDFYGFRFKEEEKATQPIRTAVEVGVTGSLNVLRCLGMLSDARFAPSSQIVISPERRCQPSHGGVLVPRVFPQDIGSVYPKGYVLGEVLDPFTSEVLDEIRAPYDLNLLLSAATKDPYVVVQAGDQAFHVGDMATLRWVKKP